MNRNIAIVGAPTNLGIRTYDSGEPRQLDRAPGVLRELGLVQRLGAGDLGDIIPPPYRDYVRPAGRARNEAEVGAYCRTLGERVAEATRAGRFSVVLGGDCSSVLGCLLGANARRVSHRFGSQHVPCIGCRSGRYTFGSAHGGCASGSRQGCRFDRSPRRCRAVVRSCGACCISDPRHSRYSAQ